jgi:hypothetical protein
MALSANVLELSRRSSAALGLSLLCLGSMVPVFSFAQEDLDARTDWMVGAGATFRIAALRTE